jgi:hypothetical protein
MVRFSVKKPNDEESKEQYQVKISKRYAAFENLDDRTSVGLDIFSNREYQNFSKR